jgi:hypothetical protein
MQGYRASPSLRTAVRRLGPLEVYVKDSLSRKNVIINLLALPLAAGAVVGAIGQARAAATMDQKAAAYQTKPKGSAQCSGCSLYVPAKTNPSKANGTCNLVKGAIAPQGWCKFYSAKKK